MSTHPDSDSLSWASGEQGWIRREYLGTVMSLFPSGKYWTYWATSNVTDDEIETDSIFREELDEALAESNVTLECSDSDPCDLFAHKFVPLPEGCAVYRLYAYWSSYIMNDEYDSISKEEADACDAAIATIEKDGYHIVDVQGESYFGEPDCGGLKGDICDYIARINTSP